IRMEGNLVDGVIAEKGNGLEAIFFSNAVEIVGNEVRNVNTNAILTSFNTGPTLIADNVLVPGLPPVPDSDGAFANGIIAGGPFGARYDIERNSIQCDANAADGMGLFGASSGSAIVDNHITMTQSDWGAITLTDSVSNSLVARNRLEGRV